MLRGMRRGSLATRVTINFISDHDSIVIVLHFISRDLFLSSFSLTCFFTHLEIRVYELKRTPRHFFIYVKCRKGPKSSKTGEMIWFFKWALRWRCQDERIWGQRRWGQGDADRWIYLLSKGCPSQENLSVRNHPRHKGIPSRGDTEIVGPVPNTWIEAPSV